MAARIRSTIGSLDVDEASRDDLTLGAVVSVQSLDAATTYSWAITFAPEGSTATFTGSTSAISPGSFTVDKEGPYMVRLVTDATLPTEDTQYVRLRALTVGLNLTLVAAGERRDGSGIIPVDVDTEGWANEQNSNLLALEAAALGASASPRTFVFRPGGAVEGNVYTDFAILYADLVAEAGLKELVLDDSITTPILIPAGTYDFTGVKWSSGGIVSTRDVSGGNHYTTVNFTSATTITGLTQVEGLVLQNTLPATSPLQYTSGGTEALYINRSILFSSLGSAPLIQVGGGTTLVCWLFNRAQGGGSGQEWVELLGADTLELEMLAESQVKDDSIIGPVGSTISDISLDSSSFFNTAQPNFLGAAGFPAFSLTSLADRVEVDPAGMTFVTAIEVQGALEDLDTAVGALPTDLPTVLVGGNNTGANPVLFDNLTVLPTPGATQNALFTGSSFSVGLWNGDLYARCGNAPNPGSREYLNLSADDRLSQTVMIPEQFGELGNPANIVPATILIFDSSSTASVPNDGDTLILNDGVNPAEVYTFRTVAGPADIQIGADTKTTLANAVTTVNANSTRFSAVYSVDVFTRLHINVANRGHAAVIMLRTASSAYTPRMYGSISGITNPAQALFKANDWGYQKGLNTQTAIWYNGDPSIDTFGYRQAFINDLMPGQTRVTLDPPGVWIYDGSHTGVWRNTAPVRLPLVVGLSVDNPFGTLATGQFALNPREYGTVRAFTLEGVLSVTKGTITGTVQLYNLTDGEAVTSAALQTTNTTPEKVSTTALTVGTAPGNLKTSEKIYEIRMSVTGSDVTDILSLGSVHLRVN